MTALPNLSRYSKKLDRRLRYLSDKERRHNRAGRFEGLTDAQWEILEPFMPEEKVYAGKPHTPWRKVCNTIFWILINGGRWADVPIGEQWGSRSASHR
ncbi:transposase [Parachlamydia sp. AcF125]|uniref:transposase n=1 Tax=Parachlamydia sp. AcF125 TaxID=2795736 RepID=UPI001BC939C4|nr:transposase [Parachlamydia sp. AcF125]MBS4168915.1 hypothetical protein [Parachlamydia sp. AcF125]